MKSESKEDNKPKEGVLGYRTPPPKLEIIGDPDGLSHLWYELHFMAIRYPRPEKFFAKWREKLPPAEECPCRGELQAAIDILPPPFDDPFEKWAFFWWTIALHDRVNVLLGKKIWHPRSLESPLVKSVVIDTVEVA